MVPQGEGGSQEGELPQGVCQDVDRADHTGYSSAHRESGSYEVPVDRQLPIAERRTPKEAFRWVDTFEPLPEIGVGASYANGWRQLKEHFLVLFLIGILSVLISAGSAIFNIARVLGDSGAVVAGILSFV